MKDEVLVSVFCAAFNQEKYIQKCLESLVSQKTTFKYEILIHDDASTDRTAEIIREYEKKYPELIKPLYQKENQYSKGVRITEKYQFSRAGGKYVAFCEGDDFWCDDYKLQKQYDILEKNAECSACVNTTKCCNEDGSYNERVIPAQSLNLQKGIHASGDICAMIFRGYSFQTTSYFFRREVLEYAFSNQYSHGINGDEAYLLAAVKLGSFYYLDESMTCYRLNSSGSWNEHLQTWDMQKKIKHQLKFQEAHFIFYNETERKFREQLIEFIIRRCYIQDKKYLKHIVGVTDISVKEILKRCDLKHKLFFWSILYCPPVWKWYLKRRSI